MLSPQTERFAVPLPGQKFKDCEACPELVLLPQGSFRMGAPEHEQDREVSEGPVHDVSIGYSVVMGRTEVTRGEFSLFAASSGYRTDAERGQGCAGWVDGEWKTDKSRHWRNPGFAQTDAHPVTCISWNDAVAYVDWLNELTPGKRFRLPSEAEWEYAARAGEGSQRFPWSNDAEYSELCAHANGADQSTRLKLAMAAKWPVASCDDGHAYTAPAASFRSNGYGLFDMHGNVWEWVQDVWHAQYNGAPADGSAWSRGGDPERRAMRGGAWDGNPKALRSSDRERDTADYSDSGTGFRVVRTF
jgi:formylglycine-generating enzyme required for sulfatase activity